MSFLLRLLLRTVCAGVHSMHAKHINQCLKAVVIENRYYLQIRIEETQICLRSGSVRYRHQRVIKVWFVRLGVHSCFGFRYLIHGNRAIQSKASFKGYNAFFRPDLPPQPLVLVLGHAYLQHSRHSCAHSCAGLQSPIPTKWSTTATQVYDTPIRSQHDLGQWQGKLSGPNTLVSWHLTAAAVAVKENSLGISPVFALEWGLFFLKGAI